MASVVNTNVMSINAQRQLGKSQATQNEAMERLSSGLRINSAKDDAAGLAISTGMQSQIKGNTQAVRNANDGVSMTQTAEGSMDEMTNILQRMRELSVQSANATNSSENRQSIQTEVDQLYSELGRISEATEFNGIKLLDGSAEDVTLQIGANNGNTMQVSIADVSAGALGIDGGVTKGDLNGGRVSGDAITAGSVQINDIDIGAVTDAKPGAAGIADAINNRSSETNVTANAYNSIEGSNGDAVTGVTTGLTIKVGNGDEVTLGATNSMDNLKDTINKEVSGVNATISSDGQLQLTNDTGESIKIGGSGAAAAGLEDGTYEGYVALSSTTDEPIKVEGSTTDFGLMETNGAGSITGAASQTGDITEDDAITINGEELVVAGLSPGAATSQEQVDAINKLTDKTGVTATLGTNTIDQTSDYAAAVATVATYTLSDAHAAFIKDDETFDSGGGFKFDGFSVDVNNVSTVAELATALNGVTEISDNYTFSGTDGTLTITAKNAGDNALGVFEIEDATNATNGATLKTALNGLEGGVTSTPTPGSDQVGYAAGKAIILTSNDGSEIEIKSNADTNGEQTAALTKLGMIETGGTKADDLGIDVTTAEHAGRSLEMIDKALSTISSARADLGAVQNRLGSTISNLENVTQNLSASNSRIQDADFATETSKMSKAQILQQAGTSMLSQANASAQSVLSLLG